VVRAGAELVVEAFDVQAGGQRPRGGGLLEPGAAGELPSAGDRRSGKASSWRLAGHLKTPADLAPRLLVLYGQ
jgi:hypothetical protein